MKFFNILVPRLSPRGRYTSLLGVGAPAGANQDHNCFQFLHLPWWPHVFFRVYAPLQLTSVESTDLIGKPRIFNNSTLISLLDRGWYFYCHFATAAVYYIIYRVIFYQARAQISFYLVFASSSNQIREWKAKQFFAHPLLLLLQSIC